MAFELPPLPYATNALEPYINRFALLRHRKLHARYVETVNRLAPHVPPSESLLDVAGGANDKRLFRAAAQAWNHEFYWHSMRPADGSTGVPDGPLLQMVRGQFGGMASLRDTFVSVGSQVFGSGWVWLGLIDGRLTIRTSANADNPSLTSPFQAVLVCDLWEHAYWTDFGIDREHYICSWFDMLANWQFASAMTRHQLLSSN